MTNKFGFFVRASVVLSYFFLATVLGIGPNANAQPKYAPAVEQRIEWVNGGQCKAILLYKNNQLSEVKTQPPCQAVKVQNLKQFQVNGQPVLNLQGSITFGTGTTTCYGPPNPTPAYCVCTAAPCP
jgi:hypothetical protein